MSFCWLTGGEIWQDSDTRCMAWSCNGNSIWTYFKSLISYFFSIIYDCSTLRAIAMFNKTGNQKDQKK